jgi:hypothetical protein
MLVCRLTGFITGGDTSNSIIDRCVVSAILTHGRQKFAAESAEVVAVGSKRMCTFPHSVAFEILDVEAEDDIEVAVSLSDRSTPFASSPRAAAASPIGSGERSSSKRCQDLVYSTAISMSDFRRRREEKIETSVACEFDVGRWMGSGGRGGGGGNVLSGDLGLCLVYTDDVDEPTPLNFLACGLCLCPPMNAPMNAAPPTVKTIAP